MGGVTAIRLLGHTEIGKEPPGGNVTVIDGCPGSMDSPGATGASFTHADTATVSRCKVARPNLRPDLGRKHGMPVCMKSAFVIGYNTPQQVRTGALRDGVF
jgi:hypothetical protein